MRERERKRKREIEKDRRGEKLDLHCDALKLVKQSAIDFIFHILLRNDSILLLLFFVTI